MNIKSPQTTNLEWLKQLPTTVALLDHNFKLIETSGLWNTKFDTHNCNEKGQTFFELFPNASKGWQAKLEYALDGLSDIQIIDRTLFEDYSSENLIWYLNPWKDGYGKNVGIIINVKDITETKKLQIELNKTKSLLKEKSKIDKIGSWDYNITKNEIFLSPVVKQLLSLHQDIVLPPNSILDFLKGNSKEVLKTVISKAINDGTPWDINLELKNNTNEPLWAHTIGRPKFKNGKCVRILGTLQNVTSKILIKEHVAAANTFNKDDSYQYFFEKSPAKMVISNYKTGNIIDANQALLDFFGKQKSELINTSFQHLDILQTPDDITSIINQLKKTDSFELETVDFTDTNNKTYRVQLKGRLLNTADNDTHVITTIKNIPIKTGSTEDLNYKIKDANQHIDKLVNFTHMVSHNLKGHATNFSLLLNFLDKETRPSERSKLLDILNKSNEDLTETIKGLREIVSIRHNLLHKKESLYLNDFIYKAEQKLAGLIIKENAKIINEIEDDFKIHAIPNSLESILINCMSNAIKFRKTDKTPVVILSASKVDGFTTLSIEDNGIGIDLKKNKDRLFGLYQTLSNKEESRGMGLYLTNYQIELMNGKITIESAVGEGSIFKIYIPNK